jgi:hypothetical protein
MIDVIHTLIPDLSDVEAPFDLGARSQARRGERDTATPNRAARLQSSRPADL